MKVFRKDVELFEKIINSSETNYIISNSINGCNDLSNGYYNQSI